MLGGVGHSSLPKNDSNMAKRKVEINITEKQYDFIDGATGEKITAEDFAKKYPGLPVGGSSLDNGNEKANAGSTEREDK